MKQYSYKAAIAELENGAVVYCNTMPFKVPYRPNIGLYAPNGKDSIYGTIDKCLGYISEATFWNLQKNYGLKRVERCNSYDVYGK